MTFCCSVTEWSHVRLFMTPLTTALQASLSLTISQSLPKFRPSEWMMPSNQLILCHPLLLPAIFSSIKIFSSESTIASCGQSIIREIQIKTAVRYHLTPVKIATIKKSTNNKCWRGCGAKGILLHCWRGYKLMQPIWKWVWRFLKKLGNHNMTQRSHYRKYTLRKP